MVHSFVLLQSSKIYEYELQKAAQCQSFLAINLRELTIEDKWCPKLLTWLAAKGIEAQVIAKRTIAQMYQYLRVIVTPTVTNKSQSCIRVSQCRMISKYGRKNS
jgi:hypothetical protein